METLRASTSIPPSHGEHAHRTIPPSMWCVSRKDLFHLRSEVEKAVREGIITPTARDHFDSSDSAYGPSIYTVNEQFIKPVTAKAGNVSWALMCNPKGMNCDLFVTHAWQEGIYEFCDKVLSSWPRGAEAAYCCMLSNPQNLDISELVSTPSESPFAKALGASRYMLVVSNRNASIYSRIWCGYEAFLAYSSGKMMSVAMRPSTGLLYASLISLSIFCAGYVCGITFYCRLLMAYPKANRAYWWVVTLTAFFNMTSKWFRLVLVTNRLCIFLVGILLAYCCSHHGFYIHDLDRFCTWTDPVAYALLGMLVEVDRQRFARAYTEEAELRNGFSGDLLDAQCSNPRDGEAIRRELARSGQEEAANTAVAVLVRAGMSSPELREAVSYGVDVEKAGLYRLSFLAAWYRFWLLPFLGHCIWPSIADTGPQFIVWVGVVPCILWIFVFAIAYPDRRAFAAQAMFKLSFAVYVSIRCVFYPLILINCSGTRDCEKSKGQYTLRVYHLSLSLIGYIILVVSSAGTGRLARIAGPWFVNAMLANSWHKWIVLCCCCSQRLARLLRLHTSARLDGKENAELEMQSVSSIDSSFFYPDGEVACLG